MTTLVGTTRLIRFILRRDRVLIPIWIVWMAVIPMITVSAFRDLYPTQAMIDAAVRGFGSNPSFRALLGPVFGSSIGGLVAWRASLVLVGVGVIAALGVIRHTRVEEETGRRELVGSTVVGRHAPLVATLVVVAVAAVLMGGLMASGLISQGLPVAGSAALGLQFAAIGIVFAGVGALAAQVTASAGGARAIALSTLGLLFVLRAAGDAGTGVSWLSWTTPFGWAMQVRPFAAERWWLLVLLGGFGLALVAVAVLLSARRDVGSGLIAPRPGPAHAGRRLRGPGGLAWRIHRGILLGWTAAFAVLGSIYGSVADGVGDMLAENPDLAEIFARLGHGADTLIDVYLTGVMSVLAMIAAAYGVQAAMRLRIEEEEQRADPVLATTVSRVRWMGSHLAFVAAGPVLVLLAGGLGVGLSYAAIAGDGGQVGRVVAAAVVNVPAVWLLAAVVVALFGLLPAMTGMGWAAYATAIFISLLGVLLGLPGWVMDLSPFTHTPPLPAAGFDPVPMVALTTMAVTLAVAGVVGFRRRDLV